MNRIAEARMKTHTEKVKALRRLASMLEDAASNRVRGPLGHLMVNQGQAEGLREAAGIILRYG